MDNLTKPLGENKPIRILATLENCYHKELVSYRNVSVAVDGAYTGLMCCMPPNAALRFSRLLNNAEELLSVLAAYQKADRLEVIWMEGGMTDEAARGAYVRARSKAEVLGVAVVEKVEPAA